MIIHKPSLGSLDVPQKIWARSVQPFWRLLDSNRQTDKQTDKPNLYIEVKLILQMFQLGSENPRKNFSWIGIIGLKYGHIGYSSGFEPDTMVQFWFWTWYNGYSSGFEPDTMDTVLSLKLKNEKFWLKF